ncbi:hypothetical protein Bca52824_076640 [Brassica carinata]|uniref:Uncharacterized protein n=1 Tax=Brassica carinata TaxID=52824 RepID=A0A8X7TZ95_BRACI|nr:hypothetical protein Bca52824_076640 [Brassica carinata]
MGFSWVIDCVGFRIFILPCRRSYPESGKVPTIPDTAHNYMYQGPSWLRSLLMEEAIEDT